MVENCSGKSRENILSEYNKTEVFYVLTSENENQCKTYQEIPLRFKQSSVSKNIIQQYKILDKMCDLAMISSKLDTLKVGV